MIAGIVFIVVWLGLAGVWFIMSLMAGTMANDAGTVAPSLHASLLILMLVGELVVAGAGVVGGCAFIFAAHGPILWKVFWILLVVGGLMQAGAITRFLMAT